LLRGARGGGGADEEVEEFHYEVGVGDGLRAAAAAAVGVGEQLLHDGEDFVAEVDLGEDVAEVGERGVEQVLDAPDVEVLVWGLVFRPRRVLFGDCADVRPEAAGTGALDEVLA